MEAKVDKVVLVDLAELAAEAETVVLVAVVNTRNKLFTAELHTLAASVRIQLVANKLLQVHIAVATPEPMAVLEAVQLLTCALTAQVTKM